MRNENAIKVLRIISTIKYAIKNNEDFEVILDRTSELVSLIESNVNKISINKKEKKDLLEICQNIKGEINNLWSNAAKYHFKTVKGLNDQWDGILRLLNDIKTKLEVILSKNEYGKAQIILTAQLKVFRELKAMSKEVYDRYFDMQSFYSMELSPDLKKKYVKDIKRVACRMEDAEAALFSVLNKQVYFMMGFVSDVQTIQKNNSAGLIPCRNMDDRRRGMIPSLQYIDEFMINRSDLFLRAIKSAISVLNFQAGESQELLNDFIAEIKDITSKEIDYSMYNTQEFSEPFDQDEIDHNMFAWAEGAKWLKENGLWLDNLKFQPHQSPSLEYSPQKNTIYAPPVGKGSPEDYRLSRELVHEFGHAHVANSAKVYRAQAIYIKYALTVHDYMEWKEARSHLRLKPGERPDIEEDMHIFAEERKLKIPSGLSDYIGQIYTDSNVAHEMSSALIFKERGIVDGEVISLGFEYAYDKGIDWLRSQDPFLATLLQELFPKM